MKLSIIIPIYNVEKYLKRCIDSVLNQANFNISEENIEIVLVNDGSPDDSQKIIDEYATNFNCIKGYKKENGGLSDARNFGLSKATGDYIWFVDADDWIDEKSFAIIFNELKSNQLDILEFDFYNAKENERGDISLTTNPFYQSITTEKGSGINFLESYGYIVGVCFKVIRKQLFVDNNLSFPLGELNEDNIISYKLTKYSKEYKKIAQPLYYYYSRAESITNNFNETHQRRYIKDQINNILKVKELSKQETFSTSKIDEMLSFYSTNVISSLIKLKNKEFLLQNISLLEEAKLYPIKKYSYHNNGVLRNVFIKVINNKWLLKKVI